MQTVLKLNMDELLKKFNLTEQEILLYKHILIEDEPKANSLAKISNIPRTSIYRHLDKLVSLGLVTKHESFNTTIFRPSTPEVLDALLAEKETELRELKGNLIDVKSEILQMQSQNNNKVDIHIYEGSRGVKQANWNSTKSNNILRIIELDTMNNLFDKKFAEGLRRSMAETNLTVHQLTNLKRIEIDTLYKDLVQNTEIKFIDPKRLKINYEILIYNNTYSIYNLDEGEQVVEINSKALAKMQAQLFDYIWKDAVPLKLVDDSGVWILE